MGKNVLIVEDDQDTRDAFELLLSAYEPKTAASRDEALQIIKSGFKPACVVMDYNMPGMSLPEFLEESKSKSECVLLTGYQDAKAAADLVGVSVSLQKPVPAAILLRVVERVSGTTAQ